MKNRLAAMRMYLDKSNCYLNKHWLIVFTAVMFLFFMNLIISIINYFKTDTYHNVHNEIFVMSLLCFTSIYFVRTSVLWFLIPFLVIKIIDFHPIFMVIQDYFFNKSVFSPLFNNLASKDINVIIISFFIVYFIGVFLFLLSYKLINKKWHLKSSFLTLTLFVYLITTLLFHYFLIEKNYRHIINNELVHMENAVLAQERDFLMICENQKYQCSLSNQEMKNILNNKEFSNFVDNTPSHYKIKGNFSFGDIKNIYLIIRSENKWIVNSQLAKTTFHDTGNYLMICLDIAHSCWLFFFIWLNVFHFRKKMFIKNNY